MTIKPSFQDKVFDMINYTFIFILLVVIAYPLIFIVSASFSDPGAVGRGEVLLWPKQVTFEGYEAIFKAKIIWQGYANTIIYTVVGVAINIFMTITAAYVLSRKEFMLRQPITVIYVFTMLFGGGLIPSYLVVSKLGMLDTLWAMVIPNAVSVVFIVIARTFFSTSIPGELRESAMIDGCSDIIYLIRIVLPLSLPIIAVLTIFYAVGHWNAYFNALIYISSQDKYPLQLVLRQILVQNQSLGAMGIGDLYEAANRQRITELMKYGVIIVSSLPMIMLYPFLQRYFVKGLMIGAIKG